MKKWSTYLYAIIASFVFLAAGCGKHSAIPDAGLKSEAPIDASAADTKGKGGAGEHSEEESFADFDELSDAESSASKTVMDPAYFDFDSWVLTSEAREMIQKNFEWLKANPGNSVLVEGHTDDRGSDAYNLALGEKRAKSAMNYLKTLGLDEERVSNISYGEERPADTGHGEESWSKNRRAEFVVK